MCRFLISDTATTATYTLSLHDALPISTEPVDGNANRHGGLLVEGQWARRSSSRRSADPIAARAAGTRSEEHTSELQSRRDLVCRLLLEKKKRRNKTLSPGIRWLSLW